MDRFWSKVDIRGVDDCWPWLRSENGHGYGAFADGGTMRGAHVVSWERHHGRKVPRGKCVLHRCDYRLCCNYGHLFLGTRRENQQDMKAKGRAARGRKNARVKLTDNAVLAIYCFPAMSHGAIAAKFNTSRETVSQIRRGARWGWLTSTIRSTST